MNFRVEDSWVIEITDAGEVRHPIGSIEGFNLLSKAWLRSGWDRKYVYTFSWLGRPIIQLPEDLMRIQEAIFKVKPDVLIETGVAHGGSLIFYASLFKAMGKGRVVGVDIEIRKHNRKAIEDHSLFEYITLIEGSSIESKTFEKVKKSIQPNETVMVVLDSCHTKEHVRQELVCYGKLVTKDSYIVVTDGIMKDLKGALRTEQDWPDNNPYEAAKEFLKDNKEFLQITPSLLFDESEGIAMDVLTYWPGAWLKRVI